MKCFIWILILAIVGLVGYSICFTVHETQYGIVMRFEEPVREIQSPGLYFKWPWPVDTVVEYDRRLLTCDVPAKDEPPKEFLTEDKKNIEVSSYACWKIVEPTQFLEAVGTRESAETILADIVISQLGEVLGKHELSALLSTDSALLKLQPIMDEILAKADAHSASYGVKIVDFRIKRVNFPEQNRRSVFDRMRAERNRIATRFRSEGAGESAKIRAEADKDRTQTLAEAYRESQEIKGRAQAEATQIYADAYGQDPDFYEFVRTLASYEASLADGTTILIPVDSPYLKWLRSEGPTTKTGEAVPSHDTTATEGSHAADE